MVQQAKLITKFSPEENARLEIRDFVNEGLKDIKDQNIYDFEDVFDELENRYRDAKI